MFEIRSYRLDPKRRGEFINHFERHLIHPQEALGIAVLGQFEPIGDVDRFVWIRAFSDMAARRQALAAFYEDSEAWKRHGPLANEIMRSWDDVYLLRSISDMPRITVGYRAGSPSSPPAGRIGEALVVAVVITTEDDDASDLSRCRARDLSRRLHALGSGELDRFSSEPHANDFPRLPVKQERGTVISLAIIPPDRCREARDSLEDFVGPRGRVWLLNPTARSFVPQPWRPF